MFWQSKNQLFVVCVKLRDAFKKKKLHIMGHGPIEVLDPPSPGIMGQFFNGTK